VASIQNNWKIKSESVQKNLDSANADKSRIEQEAKGAADKHNMDVKGLEEKVAELNAKIAQQTIQINNLEGERKRANEELAQKTQIGSDLADDSVARQSEVALVREKLKKALADRDVQYDRNSSLEDKNFELVTKVDRLTVQNKQLLVDNKNYRDVLRSKALPEEIEEYQKAKAQPPKVFGEVLEARKPKEGSQIFEISVGENDGLIRGNRVYVYRSGDKTKYLGQAEIVTIKADTAVCQMLPRGNLVEKGDHVATKLN
jgi:chromosome segregation ATPase